MSLLSAVLLAPSSGALPQPACEGSSGPWQQEFERARKAGWFHGPLPPPQALGEAARLARAAPLQAQGPRAALAAAGHPARLALHTNAPDALLRIATGGPQDRLAGRAGASVSHPAQVAGTATAYLHAASVAPEIAGRAANRPCQSDAPIRLAPTEDLAAAVRIHAEPDGDGLSIWLGIDGDAARVAVRAAELLECLVREARENGHRLALVVCNGRRIYGSPLEHEPIPSTPPGDTR